MINFLLGVLFGATVVYCVFVVSDEWTGLEE